MKSVNAFIARLFTEAGEPNDRGNEVKRASYSSERYGVDFADKFKAEGWEQFDTDQDAHYFGVWLNKRQRQTLTYCEGDWVLVTCPDWDHYTAEVADAIRCYGEGFIAKVLDFDERTKTYSKTTLVQDRAGFLEPENVGQ